MFVSAVVVAGGSGIRMGLTVPKPLVRICGVPMLFYSLQALEKCDSVSEVVLVLPEKGEQQLASLGGSGRFTKVRTVVRGGPRRQDSVYNGLRACDERAEIVVIHDAARPMLQSDWVTSEILSLKGYAGAVYATPITDTLKQKSAGNVIERTVSRENLYAVQTPQVFRKEWLLKAHKQAGATGLAVTDDAQLVEAIGGRIRLLQGNRWNIKVTFQDDLIVAGVLLEARSREWFASE